MKNYSFEDTPEMAIKLQRLAREEMKLKLLNDIRIDIEICKQEGWDYKEYLQQLKDIIDSFLIPHLTPKNSPKSHF